MMQSSAGARLILGGLVLATLCISSTWCRTVDAAAAAAAAGASGFGSGDNGNGNGNGGVAAVPMPAICDRSFLDKMPAHIRKVCTALDSAAQLSSSLYAYLHNQRAGLLYQPEEVALSGPGVEKRSDIDHVFLRFG